jgi:hypothetical protein
MTRMNDPVSQKEPSSLSEVDDRLLQDVQGGLNQNQGINIGLGTGLALTGGAAVTVGAVSASRIGALKNENAQLRSQLTTLPPPHQETPSTVSPRAQERRVLEAIHPLR